jgi:hypothetical protein
VRPLRPVRTPPAGDVHAGRGADTPALLCSRRHRYREDGTSLWLAVGPALRVWPLNSQAAFALQLGDLCFQAAQLRRFHGLCLARSLPASTLPLRARLVAKPGLLAGSSRRVACLRSGLRSSSRNPLGNCVGAGVETPART